MSRASLTIANDWDREKAKHWVQKAPHGTRVEFIEARRTLDQNSLLWACLSDVATQLKWHGVKLSTNDWKLLFMDSLNREMRMAPNLDGTGFVDLGRSSSKLSKQEMSDLIDLIYAFGSKNGVEFTEKNTGKLSSPTTPVGDSPHRQLGAG